VVSSKTGNGKGSNFKHVILRFGGSSTRLGGGSSWPAALILFAINDACWRLEICRIVLGIRIGENAGLYEGDTELQERRMLTERDGGELSAHHEVGSMMDLFIGHDERGLGAGLRESFG
jgi:hypothetical protein